MGDEALGCSDDVHVLGKIVLGEKVRSDFATQACACAFVRDGVKFVKGIHSASYNTQWKLFIPSVLLPL